MNQKGKGLGILLFLLLWFFLISLPAFAFVLAARGQIQFGNDERNHFRVFLLQGKQKEGLGFELVRPYHENPSCAQSSVRYMLWAGDPENVTFCQCFELPGGTALPAISGPCVQP